MRLGPALILIVLCMGRASLAQSVGAHPMSPSDRGFVEISGVAATSPSGDEVSTRHVAPQLAMGMRLGQSFSATLTAAAAYTSFETYNEERRSAFRLGNPILALHYALWEDEGGFVRVGLATGPPLVTVPGMIPANTAAAYSDAVSAQARGLQGYWLWARNAVPIALLLSGQWNLRSGVLIGSEIQPAFLFSVNSAPSRQGLLANASVAYHLGPLTPGLRGQVFLGSKPLAGHDFNQVSLAAFVRLDLGGALFLRAESSVNLDGPYGFRGGKGATIWGTSAGLGVRW